LGILRGMRAWILIAVAVASAPAWAARSSGVTVPKAKLDAYFDALEKHALANGTIAISQAGVVRYERTVGFEAVGARGPEPTEPGTRYPVGSITQLFTAVLTMQLVESASIGLDSRLAEFFPELPNALDISYRDLLQHRSGLADIARRPDFEEWRTMPHARAEILERITAAGAQPGPRGRHEHSVTNYLLLGYILEKVYEKPYAVILRRQIIDKVGLPRTTYGGLQTERRLEAQPYEFDAGNWVPQRRTDPDLLPGASGIVSTPADLVLFMDQLFAGRFVTPASLDTLRGRDAPAVGLPAMVRAGRTMHGHCGRVDGFHSCVFHIPEARLSVAYASNAPLLPVGEIIDEAVALTFERGRRPPTFEPVKLPAAALDRYTGTWRSVPAPAEDIPFPELTAAGPAPEIAIRREGDRLVTPVRAVDRVMIPLGDGEFILGGLRYLLRADPERDELVVRGPFGTHYFKRAR
jgi:D-alanyl-D-alanine carboxypeptidase